MYKEFPDSFWYSLERVLANFSLVVLVGLARQLRLHLERTWCIVHRHDDLHELDLIRVREGRRVKEL